MRERRRNERETDPLSLASRARKNLFSFQPPTKLPKKKKKTLQLTDGDVVVLGEHPPVKVRRHVVPDIHLGQVAVVGHLVLRDADALLEGDGVVVLPGVDLLGDAGVGAVGADDLIGWMGGEVGE